MTNEKITELLADFIEYCYTNNVSIGNKKLFLIHQKAFFSGVTKGINKYEETNFDKFLDKVKNGETIFTVKDFNQLELEYVNNIAQMKINILNIRRNERRRRT